MQTAVEEELFGTTKNAFGAVRGTLETDPVVQHSFASVVALADRRGSTMADGGNASTEAQNRRLRAVAIHFGQEFKARYLAEAVQRLRDLVGAPPRATLDAAAADDVDRVLAVLVSELLASGFAGSFLREHLDTLDASQAVGARADWSETRRWRAFLDRLTRGPGSARVAIVVQCSKAFWANWPERTETRLQDLDAFTTAVPPEDVAHRFKANRVKRVVEYPVREAMDHHAAANAAILDFERTADLVTAQVMHPKPIVQATATKHGRGAGIQFSFADRDELPLTPLLPRAAELADGSYARRMLQADIERSSLVRLEGALRAYRISRDATYVRTGLTNLWTALEALSPKERSVSDRNPSIIERVTALVGPLMASFKTSTLVDDLAGVLRRADVIGREVDRVLLTQLIANEDGARWVEEVTAGDPVVGVHVRRFLSAMETPGAAVAASYRTGRRVEWQVRRLYRLRNETVHGATTPQNARRVLQHLLLYVNRAILTLSELLLAESSGIRSIEAAASAIEVTYFEWAEGHRVKKGREDRPTSTMSEPAMQRLLTPPFRSLLADR